MRRIDDTTVELNEQERLFAELFNLQLDQGVGLAEAIARLSGAVVTPGLRSPTPMLDAVLTPDFVEWLTGQ